MNIKNLFGKIYFWKMFLAIIIIFATWSLFKNDWITGLSSFDLAVHEAGHLVLMFWAPEILIFFGGTMMQLLFPILFLKHYWKLFNQEFSFFVILWWLGENLINVGIYMADAVAMKLHLLAGQHDWNFIFSYFGILNWSEFIGKSVYYFGAFLIFISIYFILKFSLKNTKNIF